ncbi:MAG: hypothetical protein ACREB6_13575 [Rhodospirillales bacterium]
MLISPASAAHFTPPTGSSGGGIALLIIIGVIVVLALAYKGQKKWRGRKTRRDGGGE